MEVAEKLKLKKHLPLLLVNAPANLSSLFAEYKQAANGGTQQEQVIYFVKNSTDLAAGALEIIKKLKSDALCWIIYPKKSGNIPTDLGRDEGWDTVFQLGYQPVTAAAIDEDWTALRFKKKENIGGYLRGIPMDQRKAEGIDFKNRTAQLPADAVKAVEKHEGMQAFFDALAFTHKKEYVMAIVAAKRQETRIARIEKMIQMLHTKMRAKKK